MTMVKTHTQTRRIALTTYLLVSVVMGPRRLSRVRSLLVWIWFTSLGWWGAKPTSEATLVARAQEEGRQRPRTPNQYEAPS